MSKVNLFKTIQQFNTNCNNLNDPNSQEIANFKRKFYSTKEDLDVLNEKTQNAVNEWKTYQAATDIPEGSKLNLDDDKLIQKAKLIKNASLGVQILAACVGIVAFISFVASSVYLSSALLLGGIVAMIIGNMVKVNDEIGVRAKLKPIDPVVTAKHFCSHKVALSLNRLEIIRQRRVIQSENFKKFAEQFGASAPYSIEKTALQSIKLHDLYINYKYALRAMMNEQGSLVKAIN